MAKFRNRTNDALVINALSGPDSYVVEAGEVLSVSGDSREVGDAYVVGEGDKARAYAKAIWALEAPKVTTNQAVGKADAAPKEK